jgi:hypothetical protein
MRSRWSSRNLVWGSMAERWPKGVPVHIHTNPHTDRHFVCWPERLPDIEATWKIFCVLCVGTTYAYHHKKDFVPLWKGDADSFLAEMEKDFGMRVECVARIESLDLTPLCRDLKKLHMWLKELPNASFEVIDLETQSKLRQIHKLASEVLMDIPQK